jgi:hypothetical protein
MAGDGKSSAPRVTAKRNTRFHSRASTRFNVERAPIILELTSTVIRVGYSESFKPLHIIPIAVAVAVADTTTTTTSTSTTTTTTTDTSNNLTESQWYFRLSPWIQTVYDRLMCNPATRRVVIVHNEQYMPRARKAALTQLLWNKGVPAISYMSSLEILPVAQGWKRGLIVQVSADESVCVCHADGHLLPLTYQSLPSSICGGYKALLRLQQQQRRQDDDDDDDDDEIKLQVTWTDAMDKLLLDENNPQSLVAALLACLERCPRDIRIYVISNIVFCGEGMLFFPELSSRVGKRLKQVLEGSQEPLPAVSQEEDPLNTNYLNFNTNLTMVPIQTKALQPLADHLAVASCAPHRPDWISWVAASLWAATWNRYDGEESRIKWTLAPSEA